MKIAKKCGCYIFRKTLKNLVYAHLREIRMNQVISAHANFNRTSKILGSVQQRKFIRECLQWKGTFLGMSAYLKISAQPSCDFCVAHRYRKINKCLRADSCGADEGVDSDSKVLLHLSDVSRLQPSLSRIRLMWLRAFQFWKMSLGALAIFRGIFWGPGGWPGWFLRGFGVRGARGGSFGVTNPKRDILVAV